MPADIRQFLLMRRIIAYLLILRYIQAVKQEEDETVTISFGYDPFARRIWKTVTETSSPLEGEGQGEGEGEETKTYFYVYDKEDIILEYLTKTEDGETKTETTRYIHGPGIDEPLAIINSKGTYYYHADGLGSTVALTDVKQKVVESYTYTSFGEVKRQGDKVKNTFTFTGREWDKETGLYYYRARYYDPEIGRFISEDPILKPISPITLGLTGSVNQTVWLVEPLKSNPNRLHPYVYSANSPVNLADLFGLLSNDTVIANPPTDNWPPPLPRSLCETKCYLILVNDYYWCNIAWSVAYLQDPQLAERARQDNSECKQKAYAKYKSCIANCNRCSQ